MAPEQIEGREVDGRADQYALACAAFELLAGVVPFERDQDLAVLYAHLSEPPPSLAARRPDVPAAADAVLARALAKAADDRYPSCRHFTDALRQAFGLPPYDRDPGLSPLTAAMAPGPSRAGPGAAATQIAPRGSLRSGRGLAAPLTTFVGRTEAVQEVAGLLEGARLVTVTGPGGVGKTRLAIEVARQQAGPGPGPAA
jgi:serine/threonine-protein kinase